jgi:type IV pilus assembly protein PilM
MIQLAINGGHVSVLAADKARIDRRINGDPGERRSFIVSKTKQMLAEGNYRGRKVVSCLPNDVLKITSLRLAEMDSDKIEQALGKEVAQRFGLNLDEDAINYVIAGDVRQGDEIKRELVLFAADNESIKNHVELLEEAGLRPVGIDVVPCALFRSFERSLRRQEDKERTMVFVDVGSRFTTVVFSHGREISFVKQIPIGGENFNMEIAAKLGIDVNEAEMLRNKLRIEKTTNPERDFWASGQSSDGSDNQEDGENHKETFENLDASTHQAMVDAITVVAELLTKEISLCFRYYTVTFRGKRVKRAVLSGEEAYEKILLDIFKRQLAVEIEMAQPLKGFNMMNLSLDGDGHGLLCEWAVAVGLGLRGWNWDQQPEKERLAVHAAGRKVDSCERN